MQTRLEDFNRFAKPLVNATTLHGDFMDTAQQPAQTDDDRHHWQKGAAHVGKRPDLPQVDAEAVVQFVLQRQQRTRRPAQQAGNEAAGDQARFKAFVARAKDGQEGTDE